MVTTASQITNGRGILGNMYRKKSFSNFILLALEKTVDGYVRFQDLMDKPGYYAYSSGWDYPLKKSELARVLKRLREGGLVELIDDKELIVRLTSRGKDKALLAKLELEDKKWDGKWRVVIFDIPEKRRVIRDLLRMRLKGWGFVPWQQSVWVTKKNCTKQLRDYIKSIGIKDWVIVLETDNIE